MVPFYAYISVLYVEDIEEKISMAEISAGLGFLIGPLLGSVFYTLGGYELPFLVFGTIALLCGPILYCFLRQSKVNSESLKLEFDIN